MHQFDLFHKNIIEILAKCLTIKFSYAIICLAFVSKDSRWRKAVSPAEERIAKFNRITETLFLFVF